MLNLIKVVRHLKKERDQTRAKLEQLDTTLKVLGHLRVVGRRSARGQRAPEKGRTMSAAARKRIAAAQRARWAKWRAAGRRK